MSHRGLVTRYLSPAIQICLNFLSTNIRMTIQAFVVFARLGYSDRDLALYPNFFGSSAKLPCLTFPRFAVGVKHHLTRVQLSIIRKASIAEAARPCF